LSQRPLVPYTPRFRSLDACLVRRAAAATLLADELSTTAPQAAAQVRAAARTALAATPAEREAAENDLTQVLRQLADGPARPAPRSEEHTPELQCREKA